MLVTASVTGTVLRLFSVPSGRRNVNVYFLLIYSNIQYTFKFLHLIKYFFMASTAQESIYVHSVVVHGQQKSLLAASLNVPQS